MYLGEYVNYVAHVYLRLVVMAFIDNVVIDLFRVDEDRVGRMKNSLQVLKIISELRSFKRRVRHNGFV